MSFNLFIVGLGSACGGISRYLVEGWVHQWSGSYFPYGTLVVNIVGSFLIGFLGTLFEGRFLVTPHQRLFLMIGVLGGFTTFSAFSFETWELFKDGELLNAAFNVSLSLVGCLGGVFLGVVVARLI